MRAKTHRQRPGINKSITPTIVIEYLVSSVPYLLIDFVTWLSIFSADDNCVEKFENSLDNNRRLLKQQDCPCDAEHMFSCPAEVDQEIKQTGNYPEWMEHNSNSDLVRKNL